MPARVQELRQRAALFRQIANIPTSGSAETDRILITLASQFEWDADNRERLLSDRSDRVENATTSP